MPAHLLFTCIALICTECWFDSRQWRLAVGRLVQKLRHICHCGSKNICDTQRDTYLV